MNTRYEGIFCGTSGGATVATALEVAKKASLGSPESTWPCREVVQTSVFLDVLGLGFRFYGWFVS